MRSARLVPELYCSDIGRSLAFYTGVLGFEVRFARPAERFAYLDRDGAELMLEQTVDPARTWLAGPLEHPYGRGINFQIAADDVDALHAAVVAAGARILVPLEERWYLTGEVRSGSRQFVVLDPDGYLLRFYRDLGERADKG
ncbi:MAG: VOC family protein [Alphaproteobacteria bacterium]|nr:VOC family protein [Alphaproteobacteria bacterium]